MSVMVTLTPPRQVGDYHDSNVTRLDVADNTGAKTQRALRCSAVPKRRYAGIGDIIKVSIIGARVAA